MAVFHFMKLPNSHSRSERSAKLPISRARYHLIPVLTELFARKSFSGHKIDQTLRDNHLTPQDRALFTELFYGFLRYGQQLLHFVDKFLAQPGKMPEKAKWILAIAFYQKLYLSKVPDHAIVNEAVEMTKHFVEGNVFAGVVNAVLQKFLKNQMRFTNLDDWPLWVQVSFPEWLSNYLSEEWGAMKFYQMARALNAKSPTYIRANVTKISEEKLLLKLTAENVVCQQTLVPNCLVLPDLSVSPKDVPGYHEGLWTIQNMASQRIVRYLEVGEGDEVLDACAGFGGKTLQMAELSRDKAHIYYYDTVDKKMHAVDLRAQTMGFRHVKPVTQFKQQYNKILIDAPCSGIGTISSHPEIKWFRTPEDVTEQPKKQRDVLKMYAPHLRPGGTLLYTVCSIDKNEGEAVIKDFLRENPDFQMDPAFQTPFENTAYGAYLMPTDKGESGYFFSRLTRS